MIHANKLRLLCDKRMEAGMSTPKEIVQQWHDALNQGDVEQMSALVHPEVEIGGPRGITKGVQVMREWFGRANVRLRPVAYFANAQSVIVEEVGEWLDPSSGQVVGSQQVATHFHIADGLITSIVRHDPV
jgi:ketosteroid isomerase-like protein